MVEKPGELCNGCGKLSRIGKAGELIPMPFDGLHEEYGYEAGNIHMDLECAIAARDEYKRCYEEADAAIKKFNLARS